MNEKLAHYDWGFALQWAVSCAVGTAVLGIVAYASMWRLAETVSASNELLRVAVAGAVFGALLALGGTLGPGLLLRRVGILASRWIGYSVVVTAVAMSIGVTLISNQFDAVPALTSTIFGGVALGLPMGLVQWVLLQQRGIWATIWPLVTVVGYMLSFGIVVFFSSEGREWLASGGMGVTLGTITGLGMMWLLRQETAVAI